jgi:GntR family transcriptional regulator/MocR family aminotransferase
VLADLLREAPRQLLSFDVPAGGIAIWVGVRSDISVDEWAARALQRGVAFQTGRSFTFDGGAKPFARLGFAALDESELRQAVEKLLDACPAPRKS